MIQIFICSGSPNFLSCWIICCCLFSINLGLTQAGIQDKAQMAKIYYDSILSNESNFAKRIEFAKKAADLARSTNQDSLLLKIQLSLLGAADYFADTASFDPAFEEVLSLAHQYKDTAALTRAYFSKGMISFSAGKSKEGIKAFKEVVKNGWYNEKGIDDYISILGALADLSMAFERTIDSTMFYTWELQRVAKNFESPNAHLIANTKMAFLYFKSMNYARSLDYARKGYEYKDLVTQRGYLFYFYKGLISSFIESNQPDSARFYLEECKQRVDFAPEDPRLCAVIIFEARINLQLGKNNIRTEAFNDCYEYYLKDIGMSTAAIGVLLVAADAHFRQQHYQEAEEKAKIIIEKSEPNNNELGLAKAYELLYKIYQSQGKTKAALEAHIQFKHYNDIVNQATFELGESLLETQAALSSQTQINENLERQNNMAKAKIQIQHIIIIGSFIILLLSFIILAMLMKRWKIRKTESQFLEEKVRQRTADLERSKNALLEANQKLSISNAELERFAFIASHDMKEPLRNIMNFSELLSRTIAGKDIQVQEYLKFIQQGTTHMYNLIEDILEFSTIRKNELEVEPIDVQEMVTNIIHNLLRLVEEKNVQFNIKPLPLVAGDRSQLTTIFQNLIINGIKYNKSEHPIITITHQEDAIFHYFSIEDNGIGIEPKYQNKIFELFKRLHSKSEYEGTGVGLTIVKKMVERHEGTIQLDSTPGLGTKITFSISKTMGKQNNQWIPAAALSDT